MANVKITELTAATALAGTDVLPIVDVGADATKKVSVSDLLRNLPDGTASAPALAFADDQNTGVLSPGNNSLAFATSGTQRLVIDSSGDVGIGTTSPTSVLDIRDTQTGAASEIKLFNLDQGNTTTQTSALVMTPDVRANGAKISVVKENADFSSSANKDVAITFASVSNNTATERLRIDSSGALAFNGSGLIKNQAANTLNMLSGGNASNAGANILLYGQSASPANTTIFRALRLSRCASTALGGCWLGHLVRPSVGATQFRFNVSGENFADSGSVQARYESGSSGPTILHAKARGTAASPSIVQDDDQLGKIRFYGYDGSDFSSAGAEVGCEVDGTPGSNDMPGRLVLKTTADGASSPIERMRIDSSGNVIVGTSSTVNPVLRVLGSSAHNSFIQFADGDSNNVGQLQYSHSSNALITAVNGSERMRINSSGNVGIGTSAPDNKLSIGVASANEGVDLKATYNGSNVARFALLNPGVDNSPYIGSVAGNDFGFITNNTRRMTLSATGNLGIGTSSPGELLDVHTTSEGNVARFRASDDVRFLQISSFNAGANGSGYDFNATSGLGALSFSTTSTERMRLDSSGRLAIGTTVQGESSADNLTLADSGNCGLTIRSGTSNGGSIYFSDATSGAAQYDGYISYNHSSQFLVFGTGSTERMRITSNGQLRTLAAQTAFLVSSATGAGTSEYLIGGQHSASSPGLGTNSFRVYTNGNVQNTNNSYGAISDAKLKENIVDASSQWNNIKDIRVRNYNFIEGQTHTQLGVVAQEVETVSPGLVTESPDRDDEGNDLGTVTKSVNYSVLYMKAVKALQEAMDRIETLETKVAALEAQ